MPDELRLVLAFGLALGATLALVPVAMRLALATGLVDRPGGYKQHARTTPYLGGLAVIAAISLALVTFGVFDTRFGALLIWALVLLAVGTLDDKRSLNPSVRLAIEAVAAYALWHYGLGWAIFDSEVLNVALTIVWVVGLVNAFNLMDNMDGAASTVAGVSAAGLAALGVIHGDIALALIGVAIAGACLGFLRFNLAKPARVFLGDGGSMPIGFIVAGAVMAAPGTSAVGWSAVLAMVPIVGLPILDTTLVVISRRRGGRPVLSGGRDHLTHRLRAMLGSPRIVAATLAVTQLMLCAAVVGLSQIHHVAGAVAGGCFVLAGAFSIYVLETPGRGRLAKVERFLPAQPAAPEHSAA